MKLLLLIGDTAVGKMTVGQELAKITSLRLFHNHMMIEPVLEVFGQFRSDVIQQLREVMFREFARSDQYGMIFTFMWAFDQQADWDYVEWVKGIFGLEDRDVFYVELIAPQDVRLVRNRTENRLKEKASKRNVELSEMRMLDAEGKYRCVSEPGEVAAKLGCAPERYLRIDNTELSPETVAELIANHFGYNRK